MKILELFSGTASFSKIARSLGHECTTVDNDEYHNPDILIDILDFDPKIFKGDWDIIWASPPCTTFSVMSNYRYWDKLQPRNSKAAINMAWVLKTLEIIKELKPKYWFIENPRGLLRKFPFMEELPRNTITYCQYGTDYMKPTDIWTNFDKWTPRKMCKNGMPCHTEARRGSKTGIQSSGGIRATSGWSKANRVARAIVPSELCKEILMTLKDSG
ncbi:MAG: DNA methyltransferase [Thaumarchaeota archaeon]|nr:DNA methyltransferase [Nitrososphaerota archaeon]